MTKNLERLDALFDELVPYEGKAENLAGELVRAATRIGYRYYNGCAGHSCRQAG